QRFTNTMAQGALQQIMESQKRSRSNSLQPILSTPKRQMFQPESFKLGPKKPIYFMFLKYESPMPLNPAVPSAVGPTKPTSKNEPKPKETNTPKLSPEEQESLLEKAKKDYNKFCLRHTVACQETREEAEAFF